MQPELPQRPRRLRLPSYRPFRFKRIKHPERLPSAWRLTLRTLSLLYYRRWLFLGIGVVYGLLVLLIAQGLSGGVDVVSLKDQVTTILGGNTEPLLTSVSVLASLLAGGGSASANPSADAYRLILGIIVSLAAIWAIRQTTAGSRVSIRDAFYKGVYPLVPFSLVLLVVSLEMIPFLVGAWIFMTVVATGIAADGTQEVLWGIGFVALAFISVYMLCSSLFALYIVTLPDMTPLKALKSARQLVRYRRGQVLRKLAFLAFLLLVAMLAIMLPLIVFAPILAQWVFFALSILGLIIIHAYMYTLYKALLA